MDGQIMKHSLIVMHGNQEVLASRKQFGTQGSFLSGFLEKEVQRFLFDPV